MELPNLFQKVVDFIRGDSVSDYLLTQVQATYEDVAGILTCSECKHYARSSREVYANMRHEFVKEHFTVGYDALMNSAVLLEETVTPASLAAWKSSSFLVARGCGTGDLYGIFFGYASNVLRITDNHLHHERLCVVFPRNTEYGRLYDGLIPDQMLMQKLLIETDEYRFLRVAFKSGA